MILDTVGRLRSFAMFLGCSGFFAKIVRRAGSSLREALLDATPGGPVEGEEGRGRRGFGAGQGEEGCRGRAHQLRGALPMRADISSSQVEASLDAGKQKYACLAYPI
jgi:hypothetical protein